MIDATLIIEIYEAGFIDGFIEATEIEIDDKEV